MEPLNLAWQTEAPPRASPQPPSFSTTTPLTTNTSTTQKRETVCTMICTELDPRSIARWPHYFAEATVRSCQVMGTFRNIRFNDVVGGIVNSCLLFTFAAVFSSAIFGDVGLSQYVALGTACNLITTVICQASFSLFSDAGIVVAGPDIMPTIFLATMAGIARQTMITDMESKANAGGDPVATRAPASAPSPLVDPERLLSTVLAIIMISSIFFGSFIYLLGRLKVSRGIRLIPGSILSGFLASIGYMVIVKAIKTAMPHETYDAGPGDPMWWAYFSPAIPIGALMYLQKRWHVGNPVVLIPIILIVPLSIFFIAVYASGSDIEVAREQGWLFPAFGSELFYTQLVDSYGRYDYVDWSAVTSTVPTMFVMIFIITVDSLLKQASLRKMLKAYDMRIDHELMLMGKTNIVCSLLVGVVGYPQPKLTFISYGILQNTTSRVSGMIIVLFNAVLFFSGFPLVNYLPRFWLSGVLLFAAAGFVVENLWDSRLRFSRKEYASIWVIVIINAIFSMAWAVIVGIVLSALIFAMAYSRGGSIKAVISGAQYRSSVVRSKMEEAKLAHLGSRVVIVQLHRYVFFGSAAYVSEFVIGLVKQQEASAEEEQRAVFFVFDWTHVEDVDVTALGVLAELMAVVVSEERTVLFSGLNARLRQKLADEGVVQAIHEPEFRYVAARSQTSREDELYGITGEHRRCFETLDRGMEFVEEELLRRAWDVRQTWFAVDSLRDFHVRAQYRNFRHSFEQVLGELLGESAALLDTVQVPKSWSLFRAGDLDQNLYLVKDGSLTIIVEDGQGNVSRFQTLRAGSFVNEASLCQSAGQFNRAVKHTVIADVDSTLLVLTPQARAQIQDQFPNIAIEIHRLALGHSNRTQQKIVDMLGSLRLWDHELAPVHLVEEGLASNSTTGLDAEASPEQQQHHRAFPSRFGAGAGDKTVLGAVSNTVKGVVHIPVEALKSSLILSGLRGEDEREQGGFMEDASQDLLSTNQIRDGAGEEDGRRLAQLFSAMRRANLTVSLAPSANQRVRDFRAWKNLDTVDDYEECVSAIHQVATAMRGDARASAAATYRLAPSVLANAREVYAQQLQHAIRAHTEYGTSIPSNLPRSQLPAALAQLGIFFEEAEAGDAVSLDDFLHLCVTLSTPALEDGLLRQLAAFFIQTTGNAQAWLSQESLQRALPQVSPLSIARFVHVWGGGAVDFSALCSAVSQYVRVLDLDARVEADFARLCNGTGIIRSMDVEREFELSASEAREVIWEADFAHQNGLLLFDLLEALTLGKS